jgi:hypothetical protein
MFFRFYHGGPSIPASSSCRLRTQAAERVQGISALVFLSNMLNEYLQAPFPLAF